MEQFNKVLSFVLGLIVVAVFIIIASGKFSFKGFGLPKAPTAANVTPTITPNITPKPTSKPWFAFFSQQPTAAPTPKPTAKPTPTPKTVVYTNIPVQQQTQQNPTYHSYSGSQVPTSIPNTGIPIVLFPLFGTSLVTGIFMKKTGKKE